MAEGAGRAAAAAILLLSAVARAQAGELWADEDNQRRVSLDTALKLSSLGSWAADDPLLDPIRRSAVGLFRLRMALDARCGDFLNAGLAYEQRARLMSAGASGAGAGVLPAGTEAPYRLRQLDWQISERPDALVYRHELDRAYVSLHPSWGEVTVGRQAIGLGRGVLFSAVDVFAPFAPIEVDREWRRGVDAARIEYRVSDTASVEAIAVGGQSCEESACLVRARGYVGHVDGELIVGRRAEDMMYAGVVSAAVGDAEVHGELALFDTPRAHPDGGWFGSGRLIAKAVAGASYTFDVGDGLTVLGEYHYSGFGVEDIRDASLRLADPEFQKRFLRGDTQILGRHAVAVRVSYPLTDAWTGSLLVMESPTDGSGLVSPSLRWDVSQSTSLLLSGFVPWGRGPTGGRLNSQFGGSAASLFVQLALYF